MTRRAGDLHRELRVTDEQAGQTLVALVRMHEALSWNRAKRAVHTGKVFVDGVQQTVVDLRLRAGQLIELRMDAPRPRSESSRVRIVYDDRHVVVIDKPAGVSSVPYHARETDTAMDLLRQAWRQRHPGGKRVPLYVVHRIDKATSGLLVFAKSKRAEIGLAAQLRAHDVAREYLCVVHGRAQPGRIESYLVRDRGDRLRGSARRPGQGKRAVTHVEVIERFPSTTEANARPGRCTATLCRIRLETGKTHQIRIHLAERGHPLVGEMVYIRDYLAEGMTPIECPRLLLHAHTLGFEHPLTGARIALESSLPDDFAAPARRLGWSGRLG